MFIIQEKMVINNSREVSALFTLSNALSLQINRRTYMTEAALFLIPSNNFAATMMKILEHNSSWLEYTEGGNNKIRNP